MPEEALAADSGETFDIDSGVTEIGDSLFGGTESSNDELPTPEKDELDSSETDASDETEADETEEAKESETKDEEQKQPEGRPVPQSWKKEMHEHWNALTPDVQDYIEQREAQMRNGLERDRSDANLGRIMRDTMAPYSRILQAANVDEPTMVRNLMNAHYRLSTASPQEKEQLFSQLAQNYGVKLDGKELPEVSPAVQQLQNELNSIKSSLNAREQATLQQAKQQVETEVAAFAAEHPLFDDVAEDIVPFINAGMPLKDAYDRAIWANPVTRKAEIDRISKEKEDAFKQKAKQEAAKAKKAKSANVKTRDTAKTPTGPIGTMDDTLRDTFRRIQERE